MFQSHLNVLVVCILSFVIVFLIVFLSMVFFALNLKKRHKNLRLIDNNTEEVRENYTFKSVQGYIIVD